jgi:hypothetical protein
MSSTDYATAFGFHSIPAAVILTLVYLPLFLWFIRQSIKNTTYVYISLSVFCLSESPLLIFVSLAITLLESLVRVVAFIMRAMLIGSKSLGQNLNVFIADEIMFGVGFFALLYSAYTLVLDRFVLPLLFVCAVY